MATIRPQSFDSFAGQEKAIQRLKVAVGSALKRQQPLGHVLFDGPAGLGKTSLGASVLPRELGEVRCVSINCSAIERPQDLLPTLSTMRYGEILFLDEIHSLQGTGCFEYLLTALEDFTISVKTGDGPKDPVIAVELPRFTVVAATTRAARLPEPLRDRFSHQIRLDLYSASAMSKVLRWTAEQRDLVLEANSAAELVPACHGTARWAVNLVEACQDTAINNRGLQHGPIGPQDVQETLERMGFVRGLTEAEHRYLVALGGRQGKPTGVGTLAAMLDENSQQVEEVTEPWLLQNLLIEKTPQGRLLASRGRLHLEATNEQLS